MDVEYRKEREFWFMAYCEYNNAFWDTVICDSHPFEEIRRLNKIACASSRFTLISFQKITGKEYSLFNH